MKVQNELKKLLEKEAIAFSTADKKGNPHVIAVGFVKVISKDEILITANYMNETINNLKQNKNVALAIWCRNWEKECIGYELKGEANYFNSGKYLDIIKKIPENQEMPAKGAILVKINKIKKVS